MFDRQSVEGAFAELGERAMAADKIVEIADAALALVSGFYPGSRIGPKTVFGIEELFASPGLSKTNEAPPSRRTGDA